MLKKKSIVLLSLLILTTVFLLFTGQPEKKVGANSSFAYGADIGWMTQLEDEGVRWIDHNNQIEDPLQILKNNGIDSVRLRVFVDPPNDFYWLKDGETWTMLGYNDKQGVLYAAQRAQALGMRIMVDFHYSDVFADPAFQVKPTGWSNYNFNQLEEAVYNHTYDVMNELAQHNIYPEWVQVGNEINSGVLLPDGSINHFNQLSKLLNKGYNAVKDVNPSAKVITHLANGTNNAEFRWWFDNFFAEGGKTDIIGVSFYPYWEGKPYWELTDALKYNLTDISSRYNKEVMVVEIGGEEDNPIDTYWTIYDTIKLVENIPNNKGVGVFYWEPLAHSSVLPDNYALGATNAIGNNTLQLSPAISAFKDASTSNEPITNLIENSSFEEDWATQSPTGWSTWSNGNDDANFTEAGGFTGNYRLSHWKNSDYQVSTYQIKTNLDNGNYTLQAAVKSSGGYKVSQMYVKNFGGIEKNIQIPTTNEWTQLSITNIEVINGQAEIGFWTDGYAGNWINVDDVVFYKN